MPIPDFQSVMLPLLQSLADGQEHVHSDVIDALATQFKLIPEERKELLPSGRQEIFGNRVGWARTYMKKAGLVESTARGKYKITSRGHDILLKKPARIDVKFLKQFPEFIEFHQAERKDGFDLDGEKGKPQTPEELLESSYQDVRYTLAQSLLERIKQCSPKFFEKLVVELLVAMGYGGSRRDAGQA